MRICVRTIITLLTFLAGEYLHAGDNSQYIITKIADSSQFRALSGQEPLINDQGAVAFQAELANGHDTIFLGSNGLITQIYERGQNPYNTRTVFVGPQQLTNQNEVVFWGDVNTERIVLASATSVRSLYDTYTRGQPADLSSIAIYPAISSDTGILAFVGTGWRDGLFQGTAQGSARVLRVDNSDPPYFSTIFMPTVANDATMAFRARLYNSGSDGIFLQRSGSPLVTITEPGVFANVGNPKINNAGDVIFSASTTSSRENLYLYHEERTTILVDSEGNFKGIKPAMNDNGEYAFVGWDATTGKAAIYTGPDRTEDRLLGYGDSFFGGTIQSIFMGAGGMNDAGQIAFYAEYLDQVTGDRVGGIYVASPVPEPCAIVLLGSGALGLLGRILWRRRQWQYRNAVPRG